MIRNRWARFAGRFLVSRSSRIPSAYRRAISIGVASLFLCVLAGSAWAQSIEAYQSRFSVRQGESLDLHVSTDLDFLSVSVESFDVGNEIVSLTQQPGGLQSLPPDAWAGPNWPVSTTLTIPSSAAPGLYAILIGEGGVQTRLDLIVRPQVSGSISDILVLDNIPTRAAYNEWAGKSLYDFNSTGGLRASTVSFLRPGQGRFYDEVVEFGAWAADQKIPVEYASMLDLHAEPTLLGNYSVVVLAGHNEYWTKAMREHFDAFIAAGGHAVILGGNTMWWQVRVAGDQLICFKDNALDPLLGVDDSRVTTNWFASPVDDPENRSIGLSWRSGGFVNSEGFLLAIDGYGGYTVARPNHWIFAGTGLAAGETFGQPSTIVGYETDGAEVEWVDGLPFVTGQDGTPLDFEIIAYSQAQTTLGMGLATPGVFSVPGGGQVFNGASVDWADGLWSLQDREIADLQVARMTYNVVRAFSAMPFALDLELRQSRLGVGGAHRQFLQATGGTPPYTFSVVSGALPPGFALDGQTGEIAGLPFAIGSFSFSIEVVDADSVSHVESFSIEVADRIRYFDGESGTTDGWDIYDRSPTGASLTNVFDAERGSRVLEVAGSGTQNGFRLRSPNGVPWANTGLFQVEWSMRFDDDYVIYVDLETTAGHRYLEYIPFLEIPGGAGEYIKYGLGTASTNGTWQTFTRDLQADLQAAQPGVEILAVNGFLLRGEGRIDDIELFAGSPTVAVPFTSWPFRGLLLIAMAGIGVAFRRRTAPA